MAIIPNEEFMERNFTKLLELVDSKMENQDRKEKFTKMLNFFGERYATAPASTRKEFHFAFPGGLCYHTLHLLQWCSKLTEKMAPGEFSSETLLTVAILSSLGKVGDLENDYYVPKNSDWHAKNGIFYDYNESVPYMRIPMRSLFLAQRFDIKLSQDEYLAVLLSEGQNDPGNASYKFKESKLSLIVSTALSWAQRLEKDKEIQFP